MVGGGGTSDDASKKQEMVSLTQGVQIGIKVKEMRHMDRRRG